MGKKVRLNVSFREKDEAKRQGARWDPMGKYWYCEAPVPQGLMRWYIPTDDSEGISMDQDESVLSEGRIRDEEEGRFLQYASLEIVSNNGGRKPLVIEGREYATVTQVSDMISQRFSLTADFQQILVTGEVTNYSGPNNGHYYFSIKDDQSLLNCYMWKSDAATGLKFKLEKGQQVAISGRFEFYGKSGKSQLHARKILNAGDGLYELALEQLIQKLREEGLFDPDHKLPVNRHPRTIGIVTSRDGQAIKDIVKTAGNLNPYVQLVIYHANVQGANAVRTVVEGIRFLDKMGYDTIIVARGGGSDEELKAYNDEQIARVVYEAKTPIISAIGHEGHWTVIDMVADLRASTPTQAAEKAVADVMADVKRLRNLKAELNRKINNCLCNKKNILENRRTVLDKYAPMAMVERKRQRLANASQFLKQGILKAVGDRKSLLEVKKATLLGSSPMHLIEMKKDRVSNLSGSISLNMTAALERRRQRWRLGLERLNGLSPTSKLVNGFGYVTVSDRPVTDLDKVKKGDDIRITIHDGVIDARVMSTDKATR